MSFRSRRARAPLALLVLAPLTPRVARAQLLAGAAMDDATRAPAIGLPVRLLRLTDGAAPVVVDSGRTYERGLFQIVAPGPGIYQLEFGMANHRATRGPIDTLAADARSQREYALPITSGGVEVPYMETQVQERAQLQGRPRAPNVVEEMRRAGLRDGQLEVVTEFVVDAQGKPEPGTLRVVRATNPVLEPPARDAVIALRFKPAAIGGIAVRQIVRHAFDWRIRTETRQTVRRVGTE
ncbi:MAG: energy transducer TonB [Gemmatirosa sp.]